jgi:hypothetical protein
LQYAGTIADLKNRDTEATLEVRVKDGADQMKAALVARGATVETEGAHLIVTGIDADGVFSVAEAQRLQIRHLAPRKLSLEAAFVRLVAEAEANKAEAAAKGDKDPDRVKKSAAKVKAAAVATGGAGSAATDRKEAR